MTIRQYSHSDALNAADTPANALADKIAALTVLDLHGLRVHWRKLMRKAAPGHLGRALLIRILVYQLQAQVFGDLDPESIWVLEQISSEGERQRKSGKILAKPRSGSLLRSTGHRRGTMFIREYAGEMHKVRVIEGGFEFQGATYRSLSEIARRITGTSWNGPRFFGLRDSAEGSVKSTSTRADPADDPVTHAKGFRAKA